MPTHSTTPVRRGTATDPCPGYAYTREVARHLGVTEARDTLMRCAAELVRLKLTPAWGVRLYHHHAGPREWVWVVMLDGPDAGPPRRLTNALRLATGRAKTDPTPPHPTPPATLNGRPVANAVAFL